MKKTLKLAVLVDCENVSNRVFNEVMKLIQNMGEIVVKRMYADWSKSHVLSWKPMALTHGFQTIHQFSCIIGKNSSDFLLVMDAIEISHNKKIDAFCLISSDSDFMGLVVRLQEKGKQVFLFGESKTSNHLANCVNQFFSLDLMKSCNELKTTKTPIKKMNSSTEKSIEVLVLNKQVKIEFQEILKKVFSTTSNEGWYNITAIHHKIKNHYPNFKPSDYGVSRFINLLKKEKNVEIKKDLKNQTLLKFNNLT